MVNIAVSMSAFMGKWTVVLNEYFNLFNYCLMQVPPLFVCWLSLVLKEADVVAT